MVRLRWIRLYMAGTHSIRFMGFFLFELLSQVCFTADDFIKAVYSIIMTKKQTWIGRTILYRQLYKS